MRNFEIWQEGYSATGQYSPAFRVGETMAETFEEACVALCGKYKDFNVESCSVWGCRLYDNAEDARAFVG